MRPQRPPYQRGYAARPLTDQQIFHASTLWEENHSLGEIAEEIGCSVYQLGFLYRELLTNLRRVGVVRGEGDEFPSKPNRTAYAIGFRDRNGIHEGFECGPFVTLREALDQTPDKGNIIVRLTNYGSHPEVVAVWDQDHLSWVVVGKKRA